MVTESVSTEAELFDAINRLGEGDTINATETDWGNDVPAGTLDGGGVRIVTNKRHRDLLRISEPDTTVKNLELYGHVYDEVVEQGYWNLPYNDGSRAWSHDSNAIEVSAEGAVIENVLASGWTHAGVVIGPDQPRSPTIRRCTFEENNCQALGYGVTVSEGYPIIEWCFFNNNRHDIAASGGSECAYEARYNHVGGDGRLHGFEMHEPGGLQVHVHQNTFEDKHDRHGTRRDLIVNRGTPREQCLVENNWFKGELTISMSDEAREMYTFRDNHAGPTEPPRGVGQPEGEEADPGTSPDLGGGGGGGGEPSGPGTPGYRHRLTQVRVATIETPAGRIEVEVPVEVEPQYFGGAEGE